MIIRPARQPLALPLRFLGGITLALALALALFVFIMRPPIEEFRAMTIFLAGTALISLVAGYSLYRLGWLSRSPHINWTLLSGYALSSILTFINVWVTARLMFINQHDLTLSVILLVFAAGIAMSLGYYVSANVTDIITALAKGAQYIAGGRLDTRVAVGGADEMASLARAFNAMATQLELADARQKELEALRRELIAWVGHDLRTPLASVRAMIEALADGMVEDPETVQRYLRNSKREIASLSLLIDDLFAMAQIDAGGLKLERQGVSLSDLISDTLESFTETAQSKSVRLGGSVAAGVDPVYCDARQIGRVLTNLVGNALRHTPAGGEVRVEAYPVVDGVQVVIKDSGEGIAPEHLPHIFEQFYRVEKSRNRATGGAGLGLAIAKGIVEAHGGQIYADSQYGQGTTFTFILPTTLREMRHNPLLRRHGKLV